MSSFRWGDPHEDRFLREGIKKGSVLDRAYFINILSSPEKNICTHISSSTRKWYVIITDEITVKHPCLLSLFLTWETWPPHQIEVSCVLNNKERFVARVNPMNLKTNVYCTNRTPVLRLYFCMRLQCWLRPQLWGIWAACEGSEAVSRRNAVRLWCSGIRFQHQTDDKCTPYWKSWSPKKAVHSLAVKATNGLWNHHPWLPHRIWWQFA
jgi:hypothetical protein